MTGNFNLRVTPALKAKAEELAGSFGWSVNDLFRKIARQVADGRVIRCGEVCRVFNRDHSSVVTFPVCQIYYTGKSSPIRLNNMPHLPARPADFRVMAAAVILNALLSAPRRHFPEKQGIDYVVAPPQA